MVLFCSGPHIPVPSAKSDHVPDILHDLPIAASADKVFGAISSPEGLNEWWTESCDGVAELGAEYRLGFGPDYQWKAKVTRCVLDTEFELEIIEADPEWVGTRVGFKLQAAKTGTQLAFYNTGWPDEGAHYRTSTFCWAMYLRIMKRYVESGETVKYSERLNV